jgi:L-ascorbate metabolism protein UlaG (beta-lactamase superfamily)
VVDLSQPASRRLLLGAAGLAAAGTLAIGRRAEAQSVAWTQPGNNNHVLELQAGDAAAAGTVKLDYFGHCAFRLTTPQGLTVMFDPWRNDPSGAWGLWYPNEFPKTVVDIGMSTHSHFDHDALDRLEATMLLDRMVGRFSFADVTITGIADKHACEAPGWYNWTRAIREFGQEPCPPNNPGHMDNVTYVVETGGLRLLIWGDNRHNPPDEVFEAWGEIDILTLPVDGSQHILSYAQADAIVERLKPKTVIPTHYLNSATTITLSTLESAEEWVTAQAEKELLTAASLELDAGEIAGMDRRFLYFGDHVVTA